jgi:hypothetical protein
MSNIDYRVALAAGAILDPASADLICLPQALHWFEIERFLRLLKPSCNRLATKRIIGGVVLLYSYY